ncbi:SAL2 phosphatase, putative [Entamoeba invadens IP1]|uniref:3'(2'),5'-bisphosphate nucleotidase n=1 Tax=Entamoeba invadens IP1 TaxID=370355 RepID=A0A0A1U4G2_ENTIV|nr:SAL2 phosphatase, putative [Entamoeba invadens IP1]ELP89152.1 SAL2 phosphatase, putative [Entamoeba invadens IP1]|eukprot:XP_004255923.1 SAL2 phosphatase, putative [Entamoeba invadens IP1]
MAFQKEYDLALKIVQTSCNITQSVSKKSLESQTQIKNDKSPVTVGDYSVQAYVNYELSKTFPDDKIVAEEDTKAIPDAIFEQVKEHVKEHVTGLTDEEIKKSINLGASEGGKGRCWVLDPIDGTLGFLRREQYAVCLGFMVDGVLKIGVLGCPNFEGGIIVAAQIGCGAREYKVSDLSITKEIHATTTDKTEDIVFCESVEASHSDQSKSKKISELLKTNKEPLRIDSQCKYMTVASGRTDVYLRLPRDSKYQEKIWDHAAGYLIVKEAGGNVTDIFGRDLDFTVGRSLARNNGIIATNGKLHERVVAVVKEVFADFK